MTATTGRTVTRATSASGVRPDQRVAVAERAGADQRARLEITAIPACRASKVTQGHEASRPLRGGEGRRDHRARPVLPASMATKGRGGTKAPRGPREIPAKLGSPVPPARRVRLEKACVALARSLA